MWKTYQKLIPLAKIHARDSNYLLAGLSHMITPDYYYRRHKDLQNIHSLAAYVSALTAENDKFEHRLQGLGEKDAKAKKSYQEYILENERQLNEYLPRAFREITHEGDLPIETVSSLSYAFAKSGLLTKEYFEKHFSEFVKAKGEYLSLMGLADLMTAMVEIGYNQDSKVWTDLTHKLTDKLKVALS